MSDRSRFSVIIVSYQVRDLLLRCLATVAAQEGVEVETWVVDNASEDGSGGRVKSAYPSVRLICNSENLGFARANNQALAQARGDFLALLNPDTELPENALATVAEVFNRHSRAGAVGLALLNTDGSPQPSCHSFPGVMNLALEATGLHRLAILFRIGSPTVAPVPRGGEGPVDWVSGACLTLRREAYSRVGGLNEDLFMYGEEMDWSWRARLQGFETVFSSAARVVHHGGASGEGLRGELFVRNVEARLAFLRKYRGEWCAALTREFMVVGSALRLAYWNARAAAEIAAGDVQPRTCDQVERFRAIMAWRRGAGR